MAGDLERRHRARGGHDARRRPSPGRSPRSPVLRGASCGRGRRHRCLALVVLDGQHDLVPPPPRRCGRRPLRRCGPRRPARHDRGTRPALSERTGYLNVLDSRGLAAAHVHRRSPTGRSPRWRPSTPIDCPVRHRPSLTIIDMWGTEAVASSGRRFNRTVTQTSAPCRTYLARDRPLGASRVLWEIGAGGVRRAALPAGPRRGLPGPLRSLESDGTHGRSERERDRGAVCSRRGCASADGSIAAATNALPTLLAPLSAARRRSSSRWTGSSGCSQHRSCRSRWSIRRPPTPDLPRRLLRRARRALRRRLRSRREPAVGRRRHAAARWSFRRGPPARRRVCGTVQLKPTPRLHQADVGLQHRPPSDVACWPSSRRWLPSRGTGASSWRRAGRSSRRSPCTARPAYARSRSATGAAPITGSRSHWAAHRRRRFTPRNNRVFVRSVRLVRGVEPVHRPKPPTVDGRLRRSPDSPAGGIASSRPASAGSDDVAGARHGTGGAPCRRHVDEIRTSVHSEHGAASRPAPEPQQEVGRALSGAVMLASRPVASQAVGADHGGGQQVPHGVVEHLGRSRTGRSSPARRPGGSDAAAHLDEAVEAAPRRPRAAPPVDVEAGGDEGSAPAARPPRSRGPPSPPAAGRGRRRRRWSRGQRTGRGIGGRRVGAAQRCRPSRPARSRAPRRSPAGRGAGRRHRERRGTGCTGSGDPASGRTCAPTEGSRCGRSHAVRCSLDGCGTLPRTAGSSAEPAPWG